MPSSPALRNFPQIEIDTDILEARSRIGKLSSADESICRERLLARLQDPERYFAKLAEWVGRDETIVTAVALAITEQLSDEQILAALQQFRSQSQHESETLVWGKTADEYLMLAKACRKDDPELWGARLWRNPFACGNGGTLHVLATIMITGLSPLILMYVWPPNARPSDQVSAYIVFGLGIGTMYFWSGVQIRNSLRKSRIIRNQFDSRS